MKPLFVLLSLALLTAGCDSAELDRGISSPPEGGNVKTGEMPSGGEVPSEEISLAYTAYDAAGDALVTGALEIHFEVQDQGPVINDSSFGDGGGESQRSVIIKGTWNLARVTQDGESGPQVGQGVLFGTLGANDEVYLDLNPGWNDNNVYLNGRFSDGLNSAMEGTWSFSTIVGPVNGGAFEAIPD